MCLALLVVDWSAGVLCCMTLSISFVFVCVILFRQNRRILYFNMARTGLRWWDRRQVRLSRTPINPYTIGLARVRSTFFELGAKTADQMVKTYKPYKSNTIYYLVRLVMGDEPLYNTIQYK